MRFVFAADHAGVRLKASLVAHATAQGLAAVDVGASDPESPVDYPDIVAQAAAALETEESAAVLVCGSGAGMCIGANRHPALRAAVCRTAAEAETARRHNHANVLCLGARATPAPLAIEIFDAFAATPYDVSPRHARRVRKLAALPNPATSEDTGA